MKNFFDKLLAIQNGDSERSEDTINIFEILFHGDEEVTLHSRFISYLISSNSQYLQSFVEVVLGLNKNKKDINLDGCIVIPNGKDKLEYQEMDILILNEKERQAIIIENKINAGDSIHVDAKEGYKGQLERYYYTIVTGKDKNEKACTYKCDKDKSHVFYLTLHRQPSNETIGKLSEDGVFDSKKHVVNYHDIQSWLEKCLEIKADPFLISIIQQYLNLVKRMTTDNKKVLKITNLIADNEGYWESAYEFFKYFKDVKWHAIHRFFTELGKELNGHILNEGNIAKVAHHNKNEVLAIEFNHTGALMQIVNDEKGFTLKNESNGTWGCFSEEIRKIKFYEFSDKETFRILDNDNRKSIIDQIIKEVNEMYDKLPNKIKL